MDNTREGLKKEKIQACMNCENVYKIELIKKSSTYNDFGQRHCPFCGLMTEEWILISKN